ncbi:MAG: MerR family transcriptional regulator [Lachnospirales bacterium]
MTIKEVSEKFDLTQDTLRYYERVGMIPTVTRNTSGIRDYQKHDLAWVELVKCMRSAGLTVEVLVEYVKLSQEGDATIESRLNLLSEQRENLIEQKMKIDKSLERLEYKIEIYGKALETGILVWEHKDE